MCLCCVEVGGWKKPCFPLYVSDALISCSHQQFVPHCLVSVASNVSVSLMLTILHGTKPRTILVPSSSSVYDWLEVCVCSLRAAHQWHFFCKTCNIDGWYGIILSLFSLTSYSLIHDSVDR